MPIRLLHTAVCSVCALLLCLLGSCTRDAERTWPLWGDLEAFTTTVPGDTTTFTGIRHRLTHDTIVNPQHFIRVDADTFIIRATLPDGRIMAYSHRGRSIGGRLYDSFSRIQWNDSIETTYYIGTAYKNAYYYFPRQRRFIDISDARIHRDGFVVPTADGDSLYYDYRGNIVTQD